MKSRSSSRSRGASASRSGSPKRSSGGRKTSFTKSSGGRKYNKGPNHSFKKGGRRRSGKNNAPSERIDYARFVQKAVHVEAKPYVAKHTFKDFSFDERLQKNIARKGYVSPRPIQDQSIPATMAGSDVFGLANTGTGKTAAFLLPLIDKVMLDKKEKVLILAPTRELAIQIEEEFRSLAFGSGIFGVSVVGGLPINKQINQIKRGVSFVIGTPGRVTDLIKRKALDLSSYKNVVLDEADRMLDMGFRDDMVFILNQTNKTRQTLFFSATLTPEIKTLSNEFLNKPKFISVVSGETAKNIEASVVRAKKGQKLEKLQEILSAEEVEKVLIFREMKRSVDELTKELKSLGFRVGGIHGDKRSRERLRTLGYFKKDEINILIATDVAARGLDIPDVTHVVNYDMPRTYDTYVHRIGRTGRAGKQGSAYTFIPG